MITLFAVAAILQVPGSWVTIGEIRPPGRPPSYYASIPSVDPLVGPDGVSKKASLMLACVSGSRQVAIKWPTNLGTGTAPVFWSFDYSPSVMEALEILPSGATVYMQGPDADAFMDEVSTSTVVSFRVPMYEGHQDAVFALAGGAEVVASVRRSCPGW